MYLKIILIVTLLFFGKITIEEIHYKEISCPEDRTGCLVMHYEETFTVYYKVSLEQANKMNGFWQNDTLQVNIYE